MSVMKAMALHECADIESNPRPLQLTDLPMPVPKSAEILIRITACGVCHTELDEIEGRMRPSRLPRVPGHQIVGRVVRIGREVEERFHEGDRVGVGWIGSACGTCAYCAEGRENLCPDFRATGRDVDGGYAEYMTVHGDFAYPIPDVFTDAEAAPLLCAGAIGYRSLKLTGLKDGQRLGLSGFGASAHLVLKLARHMFPGTRVFVFARNERERAFAEDLGAVWAGDFSDPSPDGMDAVIDTTPAWRPVIESLRHLRPGGRLVVNAIRKEDADKDALLKLDYPAHLWMEKEIKSVANVSRSDISEFLEIAAEIPIKPEIEKYGLEDANRALVEMKKGVIHGAKVLIVG